MFSAKKSRKPLSQLEHLVMNLVWSCGFASADEVREGLAAQRPLKESTVRTILQRLEKKGYVKHSIEGRTYIYTGVDEPRQVAVSAVRQLIDRFCGGSAEELLVGMVDSAILDEAELRRVARRIARRKGRAREG